MRNSQLFAKLDAFLMASIVVLSGVSPAADPVVVLCPYTIAGRVIEYDGRACEAADNITLIVRGTNNAVLCKSKVFNPGNPTAWNYRLDIPVAARASGGYTQAGDVLTLTAIDGKGTVYEGLIQGTDAVIGAAGETATVRILLADDANGNGIADSYEKAKEYEMWIADIPDEVFDPGKDYDGDGISNFNEYLAGTDPFDPNDYFRASKVAPFETPAGDGLFALTFEANAGRSYVIKETDELKRDATQWTRGVFRLSPDSSVTTERITNDKQTWSERTVYLLKKGKTRFYKIEMEQ